MSAVEYKEVHLSYKKNPHNKALLQRLEEISLSERAKEAIQNLNFVDVEEISNNGGHVYPEVWIKMLDTFPKELSTELLSHYVKYCRINNKVRTKALEVLGEGAIDIIVPGITLYLKFFNKILNTCSIDGTKKFLIKMAKTPNTRIDDFEVERKILRVFPDEDLRDILRAFVDGLPWMSECLFLKIFDIFPKEEVKELLMKAIKNDMDIWRPTLRKIVDFFPKGDAEELIEAFWKTSPGKNCYTFEKDEIAKLLK